MGKAGLGPTTEDLQGFPGRIFTQPTLLGTGAQRTPSGPLRRCSLHNTHLLAWPSREKSLKTFNSRWHQIHRNEYGPGFSVFINTHAPPSLSLSNVEDHIFPVFLSTLETSTERVKLERILKPLNQPLLIGRKPLLYLLAFSKRLHRVLSVWVTCEINATCDRIGGNFTPMLYPGEQSLRIYFYVMNYTEHEFYHVNYF